MDKNKTYYSIKQTGEKIGLTYNTLKFYCNEGLVLMSKEIRTIVAFMMIKILIGLIVYLA